MPRPTKPTTATPRLPAPLTTAALCRQAGVTRGMLRVYEREGLLDAPPRTAAGYRLYAADTPLRLDAIRQLKEVGFSLREIALLLAERDVGRMTAARLRRLAQEQLRRIDERLARLQVVREFVGAVARGDLAAFDDPGCDFLMRFLGAAPAVANLAETPAASGSRPTDPQPARPRKRSRALLAG